MEKYVLTRGCRERDWTFRLFTLNERQEHASNREAQSKRVRDTKKGRESYVKSEPLLWVNLRLIMMLDVQNRSRNERIEAPPCPWVFRLPLVCCIVLWPRHLSQKSSSWEVLQHKCFVKICSNEFSNVLCYILLLPVMRKMCEREIHRTSIAARRNEFRNCLLAGGKDERWG
jgi:hypothetical protein